MRFLKNSRCPPSIWFVDSIIWLFRRLLNRALGLLSVTLLILKKRVCLCFALLASWSRLWFWLCTHLSTCKSPTRALWMKLCSVWSFLQLNILGHFLILNFCILYLNCCFILRGLINRMIFWNYICIFGWVFWGRPWLLFLLSLYIDLFVIENFNLYEIT